MYVVSVREVARPTARATAPQRLSERLAWPNSGRRRRRRGAGRCVLIGVDFHTTAAAFVSGFFKEKLREYEGRRFPRPGRRQEGHPTAANPYSCTFRLKRHAL
ncbi:hypothetical protein EVAR_95869_1 [Eumeta japonica]|uniref:Uncharacterized protein n=1 Tax=Eumeta variegata TaxID=151549 RepID=A0A4C1VM49_EUMVA|nr:hypothetical protein EVAR_95869_1 [Eumeta japonica]